VVCLGVNFHKMSQQPTIHLYAICWNDEKMLPFFFRHYDPLVARYYIFDNGSTDTTLDLLRANPKVVLGEFVVKGRSLVEDAQEFCNHCWKASRGVADWVIVCDVDEHLQHPDLHAYLNSLPAGTSLIIPEGYQMVSETFPTPGAHLATEIRTGARNKLLDKPEFFKPDLIDEINFLPGRHTADPKGKVQTPPDTAIKLLHFKYMGLEYFKSRLSQLSTGLREGDVEKGWGAHYLSDDQAKTERFERLSKAAGIVA
jgi:hypothetical protein